MIKYSSKHACITHESVHSSVHFSVHLSSPLLFINLIHPLGHSSMYPPPPPNPINHRHISTHTNKQTQAHTHTHKTHSHTGRHLLIGNVYSTTERCILFYCLSRDC